MAKLSVGLDVGVERIRICVLSAAGDVVQEASCDSSLLSVHNEIKWLKRRRSATITMEAGCGSALARGLRSRGYSVQLLETRQLSKFLRTRRNKSDETDAIGIAEAGLLTVPLVGKVYLKSLDSQALQSRLAIRAHLVRQRVALTNLICRLLELYGGRVTRCTRTFIFRRDVEAEIRRLFSRNPSRLVADVRYLLDTWERLLRQELATDREFKGMAEDNEVCRRFMEIPGVGPKLALAFVATIGDPARFRRTSDVGSYFGLAPRLHQSGLGFAPSHITRYGNTMVRTLLYQASLSFIRWSDADLTLRVWVSGIEQRRGKRKARIALARKIAVMMLTMWKTGETFKPQKVDCAATAA